MADLEVVHLRKERVKENLEEKGVVLEKLPPVRVGVSFDISGSTNQDYANGSYQGVMEKVFPVALALDDNGTMETCKFDTNAERIPDVNVDNFQNYIKEFIYPRGTNFTGGTHYEPPLKLMKEIYFPPTASLGGLKSMFSKFAAKVTNRPASSGDEPACIMMVTDGACFDEMAASYLLEEISHHPIFVMWIGLGNEANFEFLDRMSNKYPNVEVHKFPSPELNSDDLYNRIASKKFVDWLKGLVK